MVAVMALKREIARWGNAAAVRIPRPVLAALGVDVSSEVEMEVVNGTLIITPVLQRETPTLDELLADATPEQFRVEDDHGWLNDNPTGKELL